tara:strand:- start:126 stop:293 length:168 start_codon:yes stop_codon:yes gene_type:complete
MRKEIEFSNIPVFGIGQVGPPSTLRDEQLLPNQLMYVNPSVDPRDRSLDLRPRTR